MFWNSRNLVAAGLCLALHGAQTAPGPASAPARIHLRDQYDHPHTLTFPATNITVLTIADKKGSEQVDDWVAAFKTRYAATVDLRGLADLGGVPGPLHGWVRKKFQAARPHPVMMDWSGVVCAQLGYEPGVANILVLGRDGVIQARFKGQANESALREACVTIDRALAQSVPRAPLEHQELPPSAPF